MWKNCSNKKLKGPRTPLNFVYHTEVAVDCFRNMHEINYSNITDIILNILNTGHLTYDSLGNEHDSCQAFFWKIIQVKMWNPYQFKKVNPLIMTWKKLKSFLTLPYELWLMRSSKTRWKHPKLLFNFSGHVHEKIMNMKIPISSSFYCKIRQCYSGNRSE